jgi:hypothetical protein
MRLALAVATLALAPWALAQEHDHEIEFYQASALLPWCEAEARAHFVGQGITPYQWTSRYYDKGNMLVVEGKLRANGSDVPVSCRVARGARERYAKIEISEGP